MKLKNILKTICILSVFFLASCKDDDKVPDPVTIQYLSIPDAQFEKQLIQSGIDSDTIINQRMLLSDAEKVKVLDLDFAADGKITDLTGIEGFKNLTYLSVVQHSLSEINLSYNKLLDTLYLM
jgi:hypothetical protein